MLVGHLFRNLPRPLGHEGISDSEICSKMSSTPSEVWDILPIQCESMIGRRVRGYEELVLFCFFLYVVFALLKIAGSIVFLYAKRFMSPAVCATNPPGGRNSLASVSNTVRASSTVSGAATPR